MKTQEIAQKVFYFVFLLRIIANLIPFRLQKVKYVLFKLIHVLLLVLLQKKIVIFKRTTKSFTSLVSRQNTFLNVSRIVHTHNIIKLGLLNIF